MTSLVVILKDAKQTVPDFLEMGGGGGGDGGHRNFGGSDFRQTVKPQAHGAYQFSFTLYVKLGKCEISSCNLAIMISYVRIGGAAEDEEW